MVGPKSTQTRVVGITLTDKMYPYMLYHRNPVAFMNIRCRVGHVSVMNQVGMHYDYEL